MERQGLILLGGKAKAMKNYIHVVLAALFAWCVLLGCAPGNARAAEPLAINIATYKGSLISLPAEVAKAKGFFKLHGLTASLLSFNSCPDQIAALEGGGVDTVACPEPLVIKDNAKGFHLMAVTNNIAAQEYTLLARKGMARPNRYKPYPQNILDMKGKVVGITVRGSDVENVARVFLKNAGLDPDQDVTWLTVGGPLTSIAAFKAGRLDYLVAWEPMQTVLVSVDHLADVVLDTRTGQGSPLFKDYISNMTQARQSVLRKSPEKFKRLAAVWAETIAYMKNPAHFDDLVAIYSSGSGLGKPAIEDMLRDNLRYFDSSISCTALDNVVKFEVDVGDVPQAKAPSCKDLVWSGSDAYLH